MEVRGDVGLGLEGPNEEDRARGEDQGSADVMLPRHEVAVILRLHAHAASLVDSPLENDGE